MLRDLGEASPTVADSAFVSEMAYLVGDVTLGESSSVWPFVCLRGDGDPVRIGNETNVQEGTTVHGATLGDRVTVGHNVVVDYCTIHSDTLIGMGSCVLGGATVESNCIVAANSVVLSDQTIPEGHLAYGAPAEIRPITDGQLREIQQTHDVYVDLCAQYRHAGLTSSDR